MNFQMYELEINSVTKSEIDIIYTGEKNYGISILVEVHFMSKVGIIVVELNKVQQMLTGIFFLRCQKKLRHVLFI